MSAELLEEIACQGFEIIKDDNGQDLVKLVFMNENSEETGVALVGLEDAKKILDGEATLQNVLDEDGKQVLTLASVENTEPELTTEPFDKDDAQQTGDIEQDGEPATECSNTNQNDIDSVIKNVQSDTEESKEDSNTDVVEVQNTIADESTYPEGAEQYTLSEQTTIVNNKPVQTVTLVDAQGHVLDHKQGQAGEQVVLEMHGQMFSYELQGPSATGEAITSTLLVSSSDPDAEEDGALEDPKCDAVASVDANTIAVTNDGTWQEPTEEDDQTNPPNGQQFTLTETTVQLDDGACVQTVILTDDQNAVLDQKRGQVGEHVIIEIMGNSLEYVFSGRKETTTIVLTTDAEGTEGDQSEESEAGQTAANWYPMGFPPALYANLRRQAELIVSARIPNSNDGLPVYRPEQYHRKLGPYTTYLDMVKVVNKYVVGASHGETLESYEVLRNYARIYRPSGPQSRALTKFESALNEAAAQICRFHPGLLFHKRELYHLAKETVERAESVMNSEHRKESSQSIQPRHLQNEQLQSSMLHSHMAAAAAKAQAMQQRQQPPRPPIPQTAQVGGRVASSQLAMLESRGLSGLHQQSQQQHPSPAISTSSVTTSVNTAVSEHQASSVSGPTLSGINGVGALNDSSAKSRLPQNDNSSSYFSLPMVKRDITSSKLTNVQEESIRAAAVDVLLDHPQVDLKPKSDCTNIELACWDQAKELMSQTHTSIGSENTVSVHSTLSSYISNEVRVSSVREASAIYGRSIGCLQNQGYGTVLGRAPSLPVLLPYEIACNEAAAYLASAQPQLLTHRRELSELAKKVVRNCGCLFTSTPGADKLSSGSAGFRFYTTDQLPELDLSAADQILSDPLDRGDSSDSGCDDIAEASANNGQAPVMSCEACSNIVNDVNIYVATGTDSLKKVRILNLIDCAFTGILPLHLNQCSNLVELNLSGNALWAFPRCLHLPKLKRLNLRNNPRLLQPSLSTNELEPPLVEQFPRLTCLDLDPQLASLLSYQSLAYFCPYLKTLNGEDFTEEASESTIKSVQATRNCLSTLIYSKWEDDLAGFYKKGLPKRDAVRVIETLALHTIKRSVEIAKPLTHCKGVLARRVAEDFLAPKMLEDECEDETLEKTAQSEEATDEEDEEDGDASDSENEDASKEDAVDKPKRSAKRSKSKKPILSESTQASVAEREAEAAAANLSLLPDEQPDRLVNVVGQALRHGKTVVYAVIRTAARQPNGELIPVGGLGTSTSCSTPATVSHHGLDSTPSTAYYEEFDQPSKTTTKPKPAVQKARKRTTPSVTPGPRRSGLLSRSITSSLSTTPAHVKAAAMTTTAASAAALVSTPSSLTKTTPVVTTIKQRRPQASDYIIRPSTNSQEPAYVVPSSALKKTPVQKPQPLPPKPRARQSTATPSKVKKEPLADALQTSMILKNVPIPPPHAPPPPTMRMTTRDSNRMKRFSAYGVINTSDALAGKEEALLAAALAVEDEKEVELAKSLMETSTVVLSEHDTALAETAAAKSKASDTIIVVGKKTADLKDLEVKIIETPVTSPLKLSPSPKSSQKSVQAKSPQISHVEQSESPLQITENVGRRTRRPVASREAPAPSNEDEVSTPHAETTPSASGVTTRKRLLSMPSSPASVDPKRCKQVGSTTQDSEGGASPTTTALSTGLSSLGQVVDYDPLHFIRCHARDNDPLDCETKVWRCAFEPNLNDPQNLTTSVVATCGGECVCLIDCRTGRVMKRFKHFGEEFYTLAWTTVEMAAGHKTNLLAAAGKLREIRLLHPEQLVCYAEMRGHKDDIACMIFHPSKPTILFSGDSKAAILIWDIGVPSAPEYRTRHQLLMRLVCHRPDVNPVLNMVFLPKYDALIAGCEDGVFSWTLREFRKEKLGDEREAEFELKIPTRREPCFDGLARLSDNLVVVKCVEEGELYVFDYGQVVQRMGRLTGSKRIVNIDIRGQLRWQTTDEIYINLTARPGIDAIVCGDNEGTIWLYDMHKYVASDSDGRKFKAKPVKILEWPECSIGGTREEDSNAKESISSGFKSPVVNTTDISYDGQYLVAVTDNNLVCIWKYSG